MLTSARNLTSSRGVPDGQTRTLGFTMVEMLIAVSIIAVLTAVAVPLALAQQARAADASVKASLTAIAASLEQSLYDWRGTPPEALNVCHNAVTFPTLTAPANTCSGAVWSVTRTSTNAALTPPIGGSLGDGVIVQGRVGGDGEYCLDGSSTRVGSTAWRFISTTGKVDAGTCYAAGWAAAGSRIGSGAATNATNLPGEPTGVMTDINQTAKSVTVKWDAIAGATYTVKINGQPAKTVTPASSGTATCVFPTAGTSCTETVSGTLSPGSYSATIRAGTADGVGAASSTDFSIAPAASGATGTTGTVIAMGSPNAAPVATVAAARTNLVANPSFEVGMSGWNAMGGVPTRVITEAFIGVASAQIAYPGSGTVGQYMSVPVTAGQTYTVSAYLKHSVAGGTTVMNLVWVNAAGGTVLDDTHLGVTPATTWTRASQTRTAPAGAAQAQIRIYRTAGEGGGASPVSVYADAVMLEQSSTVNAYFDGSSTGALWTGVANLSASIENIPTSARGRAKVTWVQPAAATGQAVTYSVVSNPGDNACSTVSATACYVDGLADDTEYTFTVKASTTAGTGSVGTSNMVRTPPAASAAAAPPGKPVNVVATPTAGAKITVSWASPVDRGGSAITDYVIEVQSGSSWSEIADGTSMATSYVTGGGLTRDQTYTYRVTAVNAAGRGPASSSASTIPGFPPLTPTIVTQPQYIISTGATTMSVALPVDVPSDPVTYVTGYSTSSSITDPANLPAGTYATKVCTTTCVFTWANTTSLLGTKYYFYAFPTAALGYGPPAVGSISAPDASAVTSAVASSALACPPGYATDLGNGSCRNSIAYTNHDEARTGSTWVGTSSCYAACSGSGSPCGSPCCCWGGSPASDGWICCTSSGYWSDYTYYVSVRDATPPGYTDDLVAGWYKDAVKISKATYKMSTALPWTDANAIAMRFGKYYARGVLLTTGESADLGLCPGGVAYELWGLGGKTSGTFTPPCNN